MTARSGPLLRAVLALALGFALIELPPVLALFDGVALALAVLAEGALSALGYAVDRTGTLLREAEAGWGMDVTRVCDGHGLIIALAGLVVALHPAGRRAGLLLLAGAAAIQAFNLLRIVVLAGVLGADPARFEAVHLELFPLLTAGLMLLGLGLARTGTRRPTGVALAALAGLATAWLAGADRLAEAALVPVANLLGAMGGGDAVGAIAPRPDGWVAETALIATREPLTLHRLRVHPADFAIAWPALLAAGAAAGRRSWPWLALGAAVSAVALALGIRTEAWLLAAGAGAVEQVVPVAEGQLRALPYAPPPEAVQAGARLLQNVLVHLNLLVLPGLILAGAAPPPPPAPRRA